MSSWLYNGGPFQETGVKRTSYSSHCIYSMTFSIFVNVVDNSQRYKMMMLYVLQYRERTLTRYREEAMAKEDEEALGGNSMICEIKHI